jgi:hypothetical protein
MYGSSYVYYMVTSSGKLGIDNTSARQWAVVGSGDVVEVWFENAANSGDNGTVNAGDDVYIHANGRDGSDRVLVKRIVGDSMEWSLVRDDSAGLSADGVANGQPVPVGASVTFSYSSGYIGLGADGYVAYTGTALPFVPTMTS